MAVVMSMHWPEASLDQYEQARAEVGWETEVPQGAVFHIAWMAHDGFRVIDLWESAEDFQRFTETRLNPAVQRIGIQGQPNVTIAPAHRVFAPKAPVATRAAGRRRPARRARPAAKAKAKKVKSSKTSRSGKRAAKRRTRR